MPGQVNLNTLEDSAPHAYITLRSRKGKRGRSNVNCITARRGMTDRRMETARTEKERGIATYVRMLYSKACGNIIWSYGWGNQMRT
jgi:hypothetical protein